MRRHIYTHACLIAVYIHSQTMQNQNDDAVTFIFITPSSIWTRTHTSPDDVDDVDTHGLEDKTIAFYDALRAQKELDDMLNQGMAEHVQIRHGDRIANFVAFIMGIYAHVQN